MKKYKRTNKEIAELVNQSERSVDRHLIAYDVLSRFPQGSREVDMSTLTEIHVLPQKEWKEAVEFVKENDIPTRDYEKVIHDADIVEQKLEFVVSVILQWLRLEYRKRT